MFYNREVQVRSWRAMKKDLKRFFLIMLFSIAFANAFGLRIVYSYLFSKPVTIPLEMIGNGAAITLAIPVGIGRFLAGIEFLMMIIGSVTTVGEYIIASKVLDSESYGIRSLFPAEVFLKAIIMNVVRYIIVAAGTIAFIVPGIVLACTYAKCDYILANNPQIGPIQALRLSREQMQGKRMAFFSLQLSFMPWALLVYLIRSIVENCVRNLTWPGDVIYCIAAWICTAALLGYMRVASVVFFRDMQDVHQTAEAQGFETPDISKEEEKAREEERKRRENDEMMAREMYILYHCSHEAMRSAGTLERYESLQLSDYVEDRLRSDYARELMFRFDSDPSVIRDIILLCEEYSMDGLTDRALARIERYGREAVIPAEQTLDMAADVLQMLHSGAFSDNPGFAARKQSDILNLAENIKNHMQDTDPEGRWLEPYQRIYDMCGIED